MTRRSREHVSQERIEDIAWIHDLPIEVCENEAGTHCHVQHGDTEYVGPALHHPHGRKR